MCRDKLNWRVEIVKVQKLQGVMNQFEADGYEIDKYEQFAEAFDGPEWIIVGWKPAEE